MCRVTPWEKAIPEIISLKGVSTGELFQELPPPSELPNLMHPAHFQDEEK
jgi:hypothetical protein